MWSVHSISSSSFQEILKVLTDTTNSTSISELVWAMCWRARKCAQRTKNLSVSLFIFRSFSATLWSCWVTETDWFDIAAWIAKLCWSLLAWSLILWTTFFRLVKGLVVHTPLICPNDFPNCSHVLQKAPPQSASYSTQEKSVPTFSDTSCYL